MADPFVAEIRIWALNFAPRGWAFCDGALLPIAQNTALFSLIGTLYGGDGRTTVALPDLRGRAPMGPGNGPGLTPRREGERGGLETVALTSGQLTQHTHTLQANSNPADLSAPNSNRSLARSSGGFAYQTDAAANQVDLASQAVPSVGGGQAHNNMMPYLTLNFCIALVGLYPSRA
jgi:microcystin-dependent protein